MRKLLFASTSAVLMSGSLAFADNSLIPNDNDHMEALSFAVGEGAQRQQWQGAWIVTSVYGGGDVVTGTTSARPVSPGFLLHNDENDRKRVENQYAR